MPVQISKSVTLTGSTITIDELEDFCSQARRMSSATEPNGTVRISYNEYKSTDQRDANTLTLTATIQP